MKINDLVALANAGFTKDDIMKIAGAIEQPAPTPAPSPATPAPAPAPAPAQAPSPDPVAEMLGKLGVAVENLQKAAIGNSQQPQSEGVDDILAAIINPPTK